MRSEKIHIAMIMAILSAVLLTGLLAGCATTSTQNKTTENNKIERISQEELERLIPEPMPNLELSQLVELSKSGMSADELIAKIKQTGTHYALTPSEAIALNKQGLDSKVLDYLYTAQLQVFREGLADEIERREVQHRKEEHQLMQELQRRPYYYDPFWPSAYPYRRGFPGTYWGW
ncbi:MAG TPA: hypothetical protein VIE17_00675 [Methylophilaceae bacterium]